MYLIPRNNQIVFKAATIKPRYRYALTMCILSAVFLVWYIGVYGYLQHMINRNQQEVNNAAQQATLCAQADAGCQQVQQTMQGLQTTIDTAMQNNQTAQQSLLWLINVASTQGLVTNACAIDQEVDQGWCTQLHVSIDMQGKMPNILKFLSALRAAKNLVMVNNISVARTQGDLFTIKGGVGSLDIKGRPAL